MRKWLGPAVCALALLIVSGCSQAAGLAPQPVGSQGPTGVPMSAENGEAPPPVSTEAAEGPSIPPEAARKPDGAEPEICELPVCEPEETGPVLTLEEVRAVRFSDMPPEEAQADCIRYAVCRSWMEGVDGEHFDPDGFVTRAGLVTALYRVSGAGASNIRIGFPDVDDGAWYADAVSWAAERHIASGAQDGNFGPEKQVTREQLAVFLYRFADPDGDELASEEILSEYEDGGTILEYARGPMAWALQNRIFAGMVGNVIHRSLPVSRGQLAQALTALAACLEDEPSAKRLTDRLHADIAESVSRARHQDIQEQVDRVAGRYGAAGLQVAVIESGRLTDAYAFGWAVKGSEVMTPDHKIRIASLTKMGVGIAAMVLHEDGVIDLDESIGTYWGVETKNPYYPDDPVTIRTLMTHTSSVPVLGDDASRTEDAVRARLEANSYSRVRPGAVSSWAYNNYAYGVLGQTLEMAAGKYLDDVMGERLWSVMEIDAAFESGNIQDKDLLANIYQYGGTGRSAAAMARNIRRGQPGSTGIYFSGGMTVSARDLGKLTALLANNGNYEGLQLLQRATVDLMETRCEPQLSDGSYQALTFRSQDQIYGRDRLYYHTGSAYGVFNCVSYDPDSGDGVVVLSTGASGAKDERGVYAVCGEISRYIYETIE